MARVRNTGLREQVLESLDVSKLTPLSPEVISRQATINIGMAAPPYWQGSDVGRQERSVMWLMASLLLSNLSRAFTLFVSKTSWRGTSPSNSAMPMPRFISARIPKRKDRIAMLRMEVERKILSTKRNAVHTVLTLLLR